ncbi:TrbG/VirB9 family P-type conjugative transfer protein [Acidithiobacillus sp. M4-SHS-6]|uniref:TrbG/VirB9 family P-type conjugative transfer protein n=1 Tax=Acidithiobacillus sp. M4-SHS-6 TaxID=3383024 RepID=UPI0039BE35B5
MRYVALRIKKRSVLIMATVAMMAGVPSSIASTVKAMKAPGVAGQSVPIARTVNTSKVFQHSLNIHYGEPIRAVEQQSVRAFALGVISQLPIFTRPGGEVIVPLEQDLPVLQTAPGNFSVIILGKGVKPVSLVGAPSAEWVVKETSAGGHPILEIMPRFAGLESSVQIVATSPHGYPLTYTVGLYSDSSRFTPVLAFYRVHHVDPEAVNHVQGQQATLPPTAAIAAPPQVNATAADPDWKMQCITGDCKSIQPISVISDKKNKATYIRLPTEKTPMVLARSRSGKVMTVSYFMDGHTLTVSANPHRIDLLAGLWDQAAGKWDSLAEVRLTNEAGE